ncbi:transposase [Janthinobacterium sp. LB3P118]|uniref:transposase n=1 Tax=Janthinobacterium sp. LB3P118 TaxID=3424195 RepID=UPI003F29AF94
MIEFFGDLATREHAVPRSVVLNNASFHKETQIVKRRRKWMTQGLFLYCLPPYSPELNRLDI